jgi:hypothetical protein
VKLFTAFVLCALPLVGQSLVIRDVTLIDATGRAARAHVTVIAAGDRIVSVGPSGSTPAPRGSRVIDGKGKYLIPGLWDMHVHLWDKYSLFPLYVAAGVTGIRDMGSDFARTNRWRKQAGSPRVYTSGPAVMGPTLKSGKLAVLRVTSGGDAEQTVNQLFEMDVDFVKILTNVPRGAYFSLAHRARIHRLPFAGHLPDAVTLSEVIEERQRSIEHLFGFPLACSSEEESLRAQRAEALDKKDRAGLARIHDRIYETYREAKALDYGRRCARWMVWLTPTLTLHERLSLLDMKKLTSDPAFQYIPASIRKGWDDPRVEFERTSKEDLETARLDFERGMNIVAAMKRGGAEILAGTDTGDPQTVAGFSLHDELALLVRAGLTPLEAIQAATRNAARCLGVENRFGTIEKGKAADLVLLDADPLADIRNTRKISTVVLRGKAYSRAQLDGFVRQVQALP